MRNCSVFCGQFILFVFALIMFCGFWILSYRPDVYADPVVARPTVVKPSSEKESYKLTEVDGLWFASVYVKIDSLDMSNLRDGGQASLHEDTPWQRHELGAFPSKDTAHAEAEKMIAYARDVRHRRRAALEYRAATRPTYWAYRDRFWHKRFASLLPVHTYDGQTVWREEYWARLYALCTGEFGDPIPHYRTLSIQSAPDFSETWLNERCWR